MPCEAAKSRVSRRSCGESDGLASTRQPAEHHRHGGQHQRVGAVAEQQQGAVGRQPAERGRGGGAAGCPVDD
jgi:hypothetical protein